jgi:alpha-L-fucosidase
VLAWPADGKLVIRSLARSGSALRADVRSVELVGSKEAVRWRRDAAGLHVELPKTKPSEYALALRVTVR